MLGAPSPRRLADVLAVTAGLVASVRAASPISVSGKSFALNGDNVSYRFHVDDDSKDLIGDHFGGPATEDGVFPPIIGPIQGWVDLIGRQRREFPDLGRGDFRTPAVHIRQSAGYTSSRRCLDINSIFPKYDAVVRSVNITNMGKGNITIEKLASLSVDLPYEEFDMLELRGDWAREGKRLRRKVDYGSQGCLARSFGSTTGYSSHLHNPFFSLITPTTTESQGEAWGFSLVYTGSFSVEVEKGSQGLTRAAIGVNPYQLSWPLGPGETFSSPEAVAVFSNTGVGGMSRKFHNLYRKHLIKSKFATQMHPVLLNSWEGLGFDYNDTTILHLAQESADLGIKLFVLDDGWFGVKHPRISDNAGLGDWEANPKRFPRGLPDFISDVTKLKVANSSDHLQFGLWFEPEMVNPNSTLYLEHPDWAIHAGSYPRTLTRNQLVLNVALPEVQDFIIESLSNILGNASISYVKWDNNRGIHEAPYPGLDYAYMLGLYRVFDTLSSKFPDVRWEGCASGGGRFDPGVLQYFPHIWTSDDTDAVERIAIQFGTSLVYPPSAMGAHVSAVPNGQTQRTTSIAFRAHVAMMGGSFGFELNPAEMPEEDKAQIPGIIALAERVNPVVVKGDMWRLSLPEESNWPAALFISQDGGQAVLFCFQIRANINNAWPVLRLQGLDAAARYKVDGNQTFSGATLMNIGLQYQFNGDYDSKVVFLEKQT
ncbi:glycoside hydrolase family 36 protein [Trichoderma longibrachiatum ATCC 18648]|uniref:Alpha-galactosidase n=1 Tax=Trichoderma longibrachiatum ATCC 18648 TaxID=983965 RepID=A0A2T4BSM0_TRILO|nr:glycoside hydrolase family 36 protein [Trichoderma longibrachiatum ATCC 18648]